jgi:hypothetical protein
MEDSIASSRRTAWSRWLGYLTRSLLAVTVSMTTGEFIDVQQLSQGDLRTRFRLPSSCDPSVTASNTDPGANLMTVAIECRVKPAAPAIPRAPGGRPVPRPAEKGG